MAEVLNIKNDRFEFTQNELSLIASHEKIFNNPDADTCKTCGRKKSPITGILGGPCLSCVEEHLIKRKAIFMKHLPPMWPADADTISLMRELIGRKHEVAEGAEIAVIFKLKHTETNGKIKLGSCAKQSPKNKLLHGWDYIIEIAWDLWTLFSDTEREALLLHELCHIAKEDGAWKIEPHSVEEHTKVIREYGLWKPDLKAFAAAIQDVEESGGQEPIF